MRANARSRASQARSLLDRDYMAAPTAGCRAGEPAPGQKRRQHGARAAVGVHRWASMVSILVR